MHQPRLRLRWTLQTAGERVVRVGRPIRRPCSRLSGNGCVMQHPTLRKSSAQAEARDLVVLAADGLLRGAVVSPDQALPIYLRNRVTAIPSRSAG